MNRIKELREKIGLAQKALAADMDVTQPTISDWEAGRKTPSSNSAKRLADYFNVSMDYLLGRSVENLNDSGKWIPVLGRVAAGIPIAAIEDIVDYEEIPKEMNEGEDYFGLQIQGDSMEPRIRAGDVVIVRKQSCAETGDIVIVLINGNDATCKRIAFHEDGLSLISLNPAYPPKFYTNKETATIPVQIIGKVIELRGKF